MAEITDKKATAAAQVSHGRGGAANITRDENTYIDGSIIREGKEGDQGTGAFSGGRGGQGNIGSPHIKPASLAGDTDVIPETAMRPEYDRFHTGRGGEGNIRKDEHDPKAASSSSRTPSAARQGSTASITTNKSRSSIKAAKDALLGGGGGAESSKNPTPKSGSANASKDRITPADPVVQAPRVEAAMEKQEDSGTSTATAAGALDESGNGNGNEGVGRKAEAGAGDGGSSVKRDVGEVGDEKKAEKERKRAEWREKNPPPEHDGLGDRAVYWAKSKMFG